MCPHSVGGVKGFSKAPQLLSQLFLLLGGSDSVGNGLRRTGAGAWAGEAGASSKGSGPGSPQHEGRGVLVQEPHGGEGSKCI